MDIPQWEVSNRALEVLNTTRDAQGRRIEVCKIRLPPPQFRNYREAEGLAVRLVSTKPGCFCTLSRRPSHLKSFKLDRPVRGCTLVSQRWTCLRAVAALPSGFHMRPQFVRCRLMCANYICLQPDHIEKGYVPRIAGERLPATYINHYTANGELTGLTSCHCVHVICRLCQQVVARRCLPCPSRRRADQTSCPGRTRS